MGELAGFPLVAHLSNDGAETSVSLQLQSVPRHVSYSRDDLRESSPLGLLSRVENLVSDLGPRAEQAERTAGEAALEATRAALEATRAAARVGLPFEHTGRLSSLRHRLGDIDARLAPPAGQEEVVASPAPPGSVGELLDAAFPPARTGATTRTGTGRAPAFPELDRGPQLEP